MGLTNLENNATIPVTVGLIFLDGQKIVVFVCRKVRKMKNNFKKLLTVIILVLSMTALAACSKDEPEKATPTENPTEAVTKAPETTPTEEVTATPEPTDTAEPTATDEPAPTEEPEVTGEAGEARTVTDDITEPVVTETESGDVITDTDNVTDDSDVLPIDKVYHKFEGNIAPLSAQGGKLAQSFRVEFYSASDGRSF